MNIWNRIFSKINREYHRRSGYRNKQSHAVRWGIIGLGTMAEVFSNVLDASKEGVVAAVSSRSIDKADAFARRHRAGHAYGSYEEMLQKEKNNLDIIYIATPQKYHYEHIKMCLEHGYNVLCEKPVTSNAGQLRELIASARSKKVFLMEGMWSYCLPTYKCAGKWIEEGRIGEVTDIKVDLLKEEKEDLTRSIFDPSGGGVLLDYGIYVLAFCTYFMKGAINITEYECQKRANGIDSEWQISLSAGNVTAKARISSIQDGDKKAVITGSKGKIIFEEPFNRTDRVYLYDENGKEIQRAKFKYIFEGFEHEADEVNRAIRDGKEESETNPLEMSLKTLDIADELLKGIREQ